MKVKPNHTVRRFLFFFLVSALAGASCGPAAPESDTGSGLAGQQEHSGEHAEEHLQGGSPNEVILTEEALKAAGINTTASRLIEVPDYLETTGLVSANQSRIAHIRPLSEGVVREVLTGPGDVVRHGQPLLRYDNVELGELISQYRGTLSSIEQARSRVRVSREEVERSRELFQAEAISERELQARKARYFDAAQVVSGLEGELETTEGKLRRYGLEKSELADLRNGKMPEDPSVTTIRAPLEGTVIEFEVAAGEVIDPAQSVMTIADLASVWVMADLYENDLQVVRSGQTARVYVSSYPERVFEGRLSYLGDIVDPATRTIKARCEVRNESRMLKLGMFATVEIELSRSRSVPAVPGAALQRMEDEDVVFVQSGPGRFEKRVVETGREIDGWTVVEHGLDGKEIVVAEGSFAIKSELMRDQLGGGHAH